MNTHRVASLTADVKRTYRSTARDAQASETRRAVVAAAARLFTDIGYAATTTDAVATAAGVSRKTVFTAVGGKPDLLKTAIDWAIAGDDEAVALAERPAMREVLASTDPRALVIAWTAAHVEISQRVAGLFRALEVAAETDAGARSLFDTLQAQRLEGAAMIVDRVIALGALASSTTRARAIDQAWLSADPMVFDRMVRTRHWSVKSFKTWLADALIGQLLQPAAAL